MIVEQGNVWSKLADYTAEERTWLEEYMSVEVDGRYAWRPEGVEYDPSAPKPRYCMLHEVSRTYPSGFTAMLPKAAAEAGFTCTIVDQRGPPPCLIDDFADLTWLRPYQHDAVWFATEAGRGLIKVPTAGGKTEIFVGLTRTLPCEWLFVVHRTDLTGQAADRYALRTGETAGVFAGGKWTRGSANVTVATFQGIYAAMGKARKAKDKGAEVWAFLKAIQALNVDECHAVPAGTFYKVTMAMPNCYYRFGQSGTPLDRGPRDSLRTIGAMGPMVYKIKSEVLRKAGVLSEAAVYMIECKQPGTTSATWQETYSQLVVDSDPRQTLVATMAERAAKPCLLFIDQVAQGYDLVRRLNRLGLQADVCYGDAPKEQRKRKIKTLVQGKLDVLICSVIFQEGIDIPELASIVNAGGKASTVGVLQRMGRGMRVHASKSGFECWDVLDRGQKWLQKHASARLAAYRKENHTVILGWPKAQLALAGGGGVLIR